MNVTDSNTSDFKTNHHYENGSHDKHFANSMVFRVLALLILLALFMIPITLIEKAFDEQLQQQQTVIDDLSEQWGNEQTIIGPILSIPYVERISKIESQTDSNGIRSSVSKDIFNNTTLILLPENLRINAELKKKILTKDELQTNVYLGEIELSGNFNLDSLPEASAYTSIEWDKAFIAVGLTENKSVEAASPLRWEGSSAAFKPGTKIPTLIKQGFHANLENVSNDNVLPQFKIQLSLKGKHSFKFAPLGELSSASINSDSATIKVAGDIPASSTISNPDSLNNNFEATWRISHLLRNYPQQWLIESDNSVADIKADFSSVLAGVEVIPTTQRVSQNLIKIKSILPYIVPMLGILFLSLVILEFKRNTRAKPKFIHYIVVAFLLLLTPVVLLTLNKTTSFEQAFQIVAGTSIILIVIYVMSALKSFFKAFYILLILASLYATLYVKLQIPEYTLYASSAAGLFIVLMLMMASINLHEDE